MPTTVTCVPCMSTAVQDLLIQALGEEVRKDIASLRDCEDGAQIRLCPVYHERGSGGPKQKRAPSAYNLFIKQCLQSKNLKGKGFGAAAPYMKQCAAEYKRSKGK